MEDFPNLETERLILRRVTKKDAEDMLGYLSDPDVVKHMGLEPFQSIEDALDELRWYETILREGTGLRWGITSKESGTMIGSCGYLNMIRKHHRAEVGFELSKDQWGKGMASEALQAVIHYGFHHLELERIEALIEPDKSVITKACGKRRLPTGRVVETL